MKNREISINIDDILSLIHCAEYYGFADDVLFTSFRDWLGRKLTDEEIKIFAQEYFTPENRAQGYSEEDYESAVETLNEFRNKYIKL